MLQVHAAIQFHCITYITDILQGIVVIPSLNVTLEIIKYQYRGGGETTSFEQCEKPLF